MSPWTASGRPVARTYAVVLLPEEEGGYSVAVPALPGCYTQGESLVEALAMAEEAIALYVEALVDDGQPVPREPEDLSVHLGDAREAILRKLTVSLEVATEIA